MKIRKRYGILEKIAFISTYPPEECGIGEYTYFLVNALKTIFDGEIAVFSNIVSNIGVREYPKGVKVIPSFWRGKPIYNIALENIRKTGPYDVIHIQHEWGLFPEPFEFLRFLSKLRKHAKRVVITLHKVLHVLNSKVRNVKKYHRELSEIVDLIIVHSVLQEFELWSQGLELESIVRIPHGTLTNPYISEPKEKLIESLGLDGSISSKIVLTTPGFLRIDKGLDVLFRTFERIRRVRNDVVLIVSGNYQGKQSVLEKLRRIIELYGAEVPSVVLIRRYLRTDEILKLIAASDIIILPYRRARGEYSVSGILHLALGSFKIIVGTRVPRLVEYYQLMPSLFAPPERDDILARIVLDVLENYRKVYREFKLAITSFVEKTSWINVAKKHLEAYYS